MTTTPNIRDLGIAALSTYGREEVETRLGWKTKAPAFRKPTKVGGGLDASSANLLAPSVSTTNLVLFLLALGAAFGVGGYVGYRLTRKSPGTSLPSNTEGGDYAP